MKQKIEELIHEAQRRMKRSNDPIHGIDHVERVVLQAKKIGAGLYLTKDEMQALLLAAWWHDVGRTVTKNPSLLWMPFVDDMISAVMLWRETIRCGLFGGVVGKSTRIIFCKSLGTGKLFTRLLLRKRTRLILDALSDADTMDVLHPKRGNQICAVADSSTLYKLGYRLMLWWFVMSTHLKLKTDVAKRFLREIIEEFLGWLRQTEVMDWHIKQYGQNLVKKLIKKGERAASTIHS